MTILPTTPQDFGGENLAVDLQVNLLNKARDMAKQEVSSLLEALPSPPSMSNQGRNIDVIA